MPFLIHPYRRFPVQCSVNAGSFQGQGTIRNPSSTGWRLSGDPPMRPEEMLSFTVTRPNEQRNDISRHSGSYFALPGLPPSTSLTNVEVWNYTHINVNVNAANFIVGLFAGGAPSNINTFTAVFDEQGTLSITFRQRNLRAGQD
ncbi:MAG TPA: hypothetical protein VK901_22120 [Nitrospiraceae bacterium]|nr:hypothetical protein [Nitrospiraceae bacterium]